MLLVAPPVTTCRVLRLGWRRLCRCIQRRQVDWQWVSSRGQAAVGVSEVMGLGVMVTSPYGKKVSRSLNSSAEGSCLLRRRRCLKSEVYRLYTVLIICTSSLLAKAHNVGWRERNQQDVTNLMFSIKLLSQHVSGIIMPIIRRTRVCTTAYGVLHWLWWLFLCGAGTRAVCTVKVTVRPF